MAEAIKTPDSLVDLDGLFSSTVKGFEKYGILFDSDYDVSRAVSGNVSGTLDSRAEVRASPVKIWIKSGTYSPTIMKNLCEGAPFKKMTIIKLINANGANLVKETITFENVMIIRMHPNQTLNYRGEEVDGIVCVECRYSKSKFEIAEFDQLGTKKGQNVFGWDYGAASPLG